MTDRELLELAAKAAGIELGKDSPWRTYSDASGFDWLNMDGSKIEKKWTPLHNDGDALRLAVKLGIDLAFDKEQQDVWAGPGAAVDAIEANVAVEPWNEKAVRRAIVRAAADIGRQLP